MMNKKEQAAFDAAILEAKINRALRWSDVPYVERDVPLPESMGYSSGWDCFAYKDTFRVQEAWSSSTSHGTGPVPKPGVYSGGSQDGKLLYSTRERALRAVRCDVEMRFARVLAAIDEEIAKAGTEKVQ